MLKLAGCVLILLAALWVGFILSNQLKLRIKVLIAIIQVMDDIAASAYFSLEVLPEIFGKLSNKQNGIVKTWLQGLTNMLQDEENYDFCMVWDESIKILNKVLLEEDIKELRGLGKRLVNCNREHLREVVDFYIDRMDNYIKKLEAGSEQKIKLYKSLSMLFGLFLVVILL